MKNTITIYVRNFPALVHDHRTGEEEEITVPVTKEQLQAAQLVGQSSKELIERLCERQGYTVIEIGKPIRHTITLNLGELVKQYEEHQDAQAKWDYCSYWFSLCIYPTGGVSNNVAPLWNISSI